MVSTSMAKVKVGFIASFQYEIYSVEPLKHAQKHAMNEFARASSSVFFFRRLFESYLVLLSMIVADDNEYSTTIESDLSERRYSSANCVNATSIWWHLYFI